MLNNKNTREQKTLAFLWRAGSARSSEVFDELVQQGELLSLITVKRLLSRLENKGRLSVSGSGPATKYALTEYGKLMADVDASAYCAEEPDARYGATSYNFKLFDALTFELFSPAEKKRLIEATNFYHQRTQDVSLALHKKELERFVIELSWKSSKIEGNTYTLLDTERLILRGLEAPGHSQDEARMILNHKEAFTFVHDNKDQFTTLTKANLTDLHAILVKDLNVARDLRRKPVGITGSRYRPLDNQYQISEAVAALAKVITRMPHGYGKALAALLGISYIQPFEDGNKRTARLAANALLLSYNLAPLSYRSVKEKEYREAMLVFYELNSLVPFKNIFVEQYDFAARNYLAV